MTVGERIKNRREELNYTQEDLAKRCGYKSRSSIQKIESSRDLPLNKVEKMAAALGTTPGYLMGWTDSYTFMEGDIFRYEDETSNFQKEGYYLSQLHGILPNETIAKIKDMDQDDLDLIIGIIDKLSAAKKDS